MVSNPDYAFVDKYYEMDPATEDLLFDGKYLQDGMVVLVGDPRFRGDTQEEMTPERAHRIKLYNRWCSVSHVTENAEYLSFLATYGDGTRWKIVCNIRWPWLVKIDSLPMRPVTNTEYQNPDGSFHRDRDGSIMLPDGSIPMAKHEVYENDPETTVFRMRGIGFDR